MALLTPPPSMYSEMMSWAEAVVGAASASVPSRNRERRSLSMRGPFRVAVRGLRGGYRGEGGCEGRSQASTRPAARGLFPVRLLPRADLHARRVEQPFIVALGDLALGLGRDL